jgi:hypothetical protein
MFALRRIPGLLASRVGRLPMSNARKTRGGGKAPRREALGVFGREVMMSSQICYVFLFLALPFSLYYLWLAMNASCLSRQSITIG